MKVSELEGAMLDAAVAKAEGKRVSRDTFEGSGFCWIVGDGARGIIPFEPSSSWAEGGPIIEREWIAIARFDDTDIGGNERGWRAAYVDGGGYFASVEFKWSSPTPLIAAMRAYVASKLGDEIDLSPP